MKAYLFILVGLISLNAHASGLYSLKANLNKKEMLDSESLTVSTYILNQRGRRISSGDANSISAFTSGVELKQYSDSSCSSEVNSVSISAFKSGMNFVIPPSSLSSGSSVKIGNFPLNLISPCRPLSVESTNVQPVDSFAVTVGELASGKYPVSVLANDSLGSKVTSYNGKVSFMVTPSCASNVRISGSRTGKVSAKKGAFSLSIPQPTLPSGASSFAIKLSDPQNALSHCELVSVSSPDTTANWQIFSYSHNLYSDVFFGFDGTGAPQVQSIEGSTVIMRGKYKGAVVIEAQNWAEETAALMLVTPDMQSTQITVPGSPSFFGITYSDGTDLYFPFGTCEAGYSNCVYRIGKYSLSSGTVTTSEQSTSYSIDLITKKVGSSSQLIIKGIDPGPYLPVTGLFSKSSLTFLGWGEEHAASAVTNWNAIKIGNVVYSVSHTMDGGTLKGHDLTTGMTSTIYTYPGNYDLTSLLVKGANDKIGFVIKQLDASSEVTSSVKVVTYNPSSLALEVSTYSNKTMAYISIANALTVNGSGEFILSYNYQWGGVIFATGLMNLQTEMELIQPTFNNHDFYFLGDTLYYLRYPTTNPGGSGSDLFIVNQPYGTFHSSSNPGEILSQDTNGVVRVGSFDYLTEF